MGKETERLRRIEGKIADISDKLDKSGFYDYIVYINDEKKFYRRCLTSGIIRGVGGAIGFTFLGAIIILILRGIASSSIPLIADWISQIMDIIEKS